MLVKRIHSLTNDMASLMHWFIADAGCKVLSLTKMHHICGVVTGNGRDSTNMTVFLRIVGQWSRLSCIFIKYFHPFCKHGLYNQHRSLIIVFTVFILHMCFHIFIDQGVYLVQSR